MRDENGRFKKGVRAHPETEFKPGQHWREHKPYWDKSWLESEYTDKGRSSSEIAADFGVTEAAIIFWLRKHGINRRSMSEVRGVKRWGASGESNPMYGKCGSDNANWKGGCTPERQAFYSSTEWARASLEVWRRDKGICSRCGATNVKMHIHHIVSFSVKELRSSIDNLVLLCVDCHHFVHSKNNVNSEFLKGGI